MDFAEKLPTARGRVRGLFVPAMAGPPRVRTRWRNNLVLRSWGGIVGRLLSTGESKYKISGMYAEFVNVASPGDAAPVPAFDRDVDSAKAYFDGLSLSANRDYLRVPLVAATLASSDEIVFPDGNLLTFFAQTSGVTGTHGKNFGEAYNSVVVGGALVAFPDQADGDQDLVLSRFYFEPDDQLPKLATGQVGLEWELELQ